MITKMRIVNHGEMASDLSPHPIWLIEVRILEIPEIKEITVQLVVDEK